MENINAQPTACGSLKTRLCHLNKSQICRSHLQIQQLQMVKYPLDASKKPENGDLRK